MHYLRFIIFFAALFQSIPVLPQKAITANGLNQLSLGRHLEILEDKDASLSVKDLIKEENNQEWFISHRDNPGFGYTESAFWVKFNIRNDSKKSLPMLLEQSYPLIDSLTLYIVRGEPIKKIETGDHKTFHQRPYNYRTFIFPVKLPARSSTAFPYR